MSSPTGPDVTDRSAPQETFTRAQWTAILFVVCCGFSSQMVMPLWVGAIIEGLALTEDAAGRVGSVEFMAVAVVSVIVALNIRRCPTRPTVLVGVMLLVLGNFASAFATDEATLLLARLICGLGKGLVVAIVFGLVAGSARPTRAFATLNIVYALFATFFYLTVPYAIQWNGAAGAFTAMGGVAVAGAMFMPLFPTERLERSQMSGLRLTAIPRFGLLAFAGLVIVWTGHNVIWTFIERLGVNVGLDVSDVGQGLSIAALLTIGGPLLARILDVRFGIGPPLYAAITLKILAVLLLGFFATPAIYTVAVPAFLVLSLFITPYIMGTLSLADPDGRLAAASSAAMTAGSSLGALIGGMALSGAGYGGLSLVATGFFILFIVIIMVVAPLTRRYSAAAIPAA